MLLFGLWLIVFLVIIMNLFILFCSEFKFFSLNKMWYKNPTIKSPSTVWRLQQCQTAFISTPAWWTDSPRCAASWPSCPSCSSWPSASGRPSPGTRRRLHPLRRQFGRLELLWILVMLVGDEREGERSDKPACVRITSLSGYRSFKVHIYIWSTLIFDEQNQLIIWVFWLLVWQF